MKKKIPELIPIRRIHNYVYCPRLMYFQFVENIFVYDSNVVAGEMTHKRVDKPTVTFFSEEIENNSLEKIRSLALESADIGICGVIDLLERNPNDGSWTIYDYKHGSPAKDIHGNDCAKEADIIQIKMYVLLARHHQYNISAAKIYYAETKTSVTVTLGNNENDLLKIISDVKCGIWRIARPIGE